MVDPWITPRWSSSRVTKIQGGSATSPTTPSPAKSPATSPTLRKRCTTCFGRGLIGPPCSTAESGDSGPATARALRTKSTASPTRIATRFLWSPKDGTRARFTSTGSAQAFPKTSSFAPCAKSRVSKTPRCFDPDTRWSTITSLLPNFSTASKPAWSRAFISQAKSTAPRATKKPHARVSWRASTPRVPRGTKSPSRSAEAKPTSVC